MVDPRSNTVDDIVRRSAARHPDRVALRFAGRELTFRQLDDATTRAAAALLRDANPGDRVAAYGKNSDAYVIGFLACARAGLVHVPINYNLTGRALSYLLEQSGSSMALVDPAMEAELDAVDFGARIPLRDAQGSLLDQATRGPVPELDTTVADTDTKSDNDVVQLLYTSGTTSDPKGAMMTHRALMHEYVSCVVGCDYTAEDEPLNVMPLYHSAQMHVFLMPWLMVGATNTILETPDPAEILRRIEADRHRTFFAAPTLWVAIANHPDLETRDLDSLRKAYYGASIMPGPVLARLRERLPRLGFYNCFGQSEIAPLATVLRPEEHDEHPDSAGRPALFVEARVIDAEGNDVAPGELGEIVYRSPQLCLGYWDKPEETEEVFAGGWFHSGDLVRADEQGYITVVDRIKDVINTGGVQVASREVEDALYTHGSVAEVAVVGMPDDRWIEAVTAFVVAREPVDEQDLIAHAKAELAGFKVPKEVRFVDDLPRNSSGKLLKRVLRGGTEADA